MFLTKSIYNYLNKHIDYSLNKAAIAYSKNIKDLDFKYDVANRNMEILTSQETVTINFDANYHIIHAHCTCESTSPRACIHVSGSLYKLLTLTDQDIKKQKAKILNIAPRGNQGIEKNAQNNYRKLPSILTYNERDVWNKHTSNKNNSISRDLQVGKIILTATDEFQIQVDYYPWSYHSMMHRKKGGTVSIKKQEDEYFIKCSSCTEITDQLCEHQFATLTHKDIFDILSNGKSIEYVSVSRYFVSELNVSQKFFDYAYSIFLQDYHYHLTPSGRNILNTETFRESNKILFGKNEQDTYFQENLLAQSEKENLNWVNAFLWTFEDKNQAIPELLLLEGKGVKAKDKISSRIAITDKPRYLDSHGMSWYKSLETALNPDIPSLAQLRNLQSFLVDHLPDLQSVLNYTMVRPIYEEEFIRKNDLIPIDFQKQTLSIKLEIIEDEGFYMVNPELYGGNTKLVTTEKWYFWPLFCFDRNSNCAYLYGDLDVYHLIVLFHNKPAMVDAKAVGELMKVLTAVGDNIEISAPDHLLTKPQILSGGDRHIYLSEAGNYIVFTPKIVFANHEFDLLESDEVLFDQEDDNNLLLIIDKEEKEAFHNFILETSEDLRFNFENDNHYFLSSSQFIHNGWFLHFYEACLEHNVSVFGQENLQNFKFNKNKASISTSISSGIDWFDVNVEMSFGEQKVPYKSWIESIKNNEKFVKLGDGTWGLLPQDWYEKMKKLYQISDQEKDNLRLNQFKYSLIEELFAEVSEDEHFMALKTKFDRLKNIDFEKTYHLPEQINAELRPYQMHGFQWLCTLDEMEMGGCLADDMGLGKTLQIISLLALQKTQGRGKSLIVVPRSLLFNWIAEIKKFCPYLNYHLHHGVNRKNDDLATIECDLILTTYDTATADVEFLKDLELNYIILDESQAIKNPNSKRYKAMRLLESRNRMVMTGTPIENNTFDLYAQLSFVNPGMLGSQTHFRDKFSNAIDKAGNAEVANQLKKIISPFLLRRTKELVAKDLPEKTENIIYCEMDTPQRKMYNELKDQIKADIEGNIESQGFSKSKFKILDGLLRLRQICNSPLLLNKTLSPKKAASVKIDTLLEIIETELNNHNALIFSQFTSMLDIIRKTLDARKIRYAYLDGSTRDRQKAVSDFQDEDDVNLFLISLKAGNTGLNLVKADYVYIMDPWWNPAVEAQAIDRTHRIGQDKHIFAYKMICKDTIEEKIIELQNKKKKLAKDIIATDENIFKSLDKKELMSLFD